MVKGNAPINCFSAGGGGGGGAVGRRPLGNCIFGKILSNSRPLGKYCSSNSLP